MFCKNKLYCEDLKNAYESTVNIKKLFGKSILITGATGLIGSFISDVIFYANENYDANIDVYILARSEERLRTRFSSHVSDSRCHIIIQDVTIPINNNYKYDYIVHAAGDGYPEAFRVRPVETMTPALLGTYHLLENARINEAGRFLYISSGEVYGKVIGEAHAFLEDECGNIDSMNARSCYPLAKRAAESLCASFHEEYGVDTVVARLGHTYGPGSATNDNRATAQFINSALAGNDIVLYSEGKQLRSYTYVADTVSAILTIMINGTPSTAYNVANSKSRITISDFANILAKKAEVICRIKLPDVDEIKELTPIEYAVLDSGRLEALGWKGRYEAAEGISNTYDILKENSK